MRGVVYPVTSFRINNNANAVKNWRNALNQEDTGTLHAAPMSGGGVTPQGWVRIAGSPKTAELEASDESDFGLV